MDDNWTGQCYRVSSREICGEELVSWCFKPITIIITTNPLTARVAGAPQMILQPVFSIFSLFSTALWDLPKAQSTTKDYFRAEGDFHNEIYIERTNKAETRPEEESEIVGSCREN